MTTSGASNGDRHVYCFVPDEGVDVVVLAAYLKSFVDTSATIKPSRHPRDETRFGYTIGAATTLNKETLEDIISDSRDWKRERNQNADYERDPYEYHESDTWLKRKGKGQTPTSRVPIVASRRPRNRHETEIPPPQRPDPDTGRQQIEFRLPRLSGPLADASSFFTSERYDSFFSRLNSEEYARRQPQGTQDRPINHLNQPHEPSLRHADQELQKDKKGLVPNQAADPVPITTRSRRPSDSSATSISSIMTVSSVDADTAREFRKDFVPVRLAIPNINGLFLKHARTVPGLAFIDNGSSANFISENLCTKIGTVPRMIADDTAEYHGPTGERLNIVGTKKLQVRWDSKDGERGANIEFRVVADLTFEMILTLEMAKKTQMDLAAGPHPDRLSNNAVAPITSKSFSSVLLPLRNQQKTELNTKLKDDLRHENKQKEAERKLGLLGRHDTLSTTTSSSSDRREDDLSPDPYLR